MNLPVLFNPIRLFVLVVTSRKFTLVHDDTSSSLLVMQNRMKFPLMYDLGFADKIMKIALCGVKCMRTDTTLVLV